MIDNKIVRILLAYLPRPIAVILVAFAYVLAPVLFITGVGMIRRVLDVPLPPDMAENTEGLPLFIADIVFVCCIVLIVGCVFCLYQLGMIFYKWVDSQLPSREKKK